MCLCVCRVCLYLPLSVRVRRNAFMSDRLLPLAVAGLVTAMTVYVTGSEEHPITLVFAPMVVIWAIGESYSSGSGGVHKPFFRLWRAA